SQPKPHPPQVCTLNAYLYTTITCHQRPPDPTAASTTVILSLMTFIRGAYILTDVTRHKSKYGM
ncbi:hypothetical protein COCCADRAFT_85582, partial [Bipolaris zeicola 26-R-13]